MKLTKEQIAEIQADILEAKKTVKDDASLSKLIGAFDHHATALLSHITEQDKEIQEAGAACAAKDSALKIWANGLNPMLVTPDKIACQIIESALSPTIGQELMKELQHRRMSVTHPTIHVDYYKWLGSLSEDDQKFLKTASPTGIAMWAWSRSRETVKEHLKKEDPNT